MEHKPNWDKLQAISVLTSDSPKVGPALKKNPYTDSAALDQGRIWKVLCQFLLEGVDIPLPPCAAS